MYLCHGIDDFCTSFPPSADSDRAVRQAGMKPPLCRQLCAGVSQDLSTSALLPRRTHDSIFMQVVFALTQGGRGAVLSPTPQSRSETPLLFPSILLTGSSS